MINRIQKYGRRARQRGQAILIGALVLVVLVGVVGLAVDGAVAYIYTTNIERAASAAALAGVPYLPQNYNGVAPNAQTRAAAEAKRNGIDPFQPACSCTISFGLNNNQKNLDVTITQLVPTFFMQALGVPPFRIQRTAEAGYRAAIKLGSPDNEFGSTVSEIGASGHFYVLRQKAWHVGAGRGEGDAYTPDPNPSYECVDSSCSAGTTDVHLISGHVGTESTDSNFTGPNSIAPFPGGWDDRGGQNFRITIPSGTSGELQVYNAGFGPDHGAAAQNNCENWLSPTVANGNCNSSAGQTLAEDDGNQSRCATGPPIDCSGQKSEYNSVMYTLFQVNDNSVRANDNVIRQVIVYPVDAVNYGASPPKYINVHNNQSITQHYLTGGAPANMRTYHSWSNIGSETGLDNSATPDPNAQGLIKAKGFNPTATGSGTSVDCTTSCGTLPGGTYRLRVDLLDADGNPAKIGSSNHAYALRVVNVGTPPDAPSTANVCSVTAGSPPVTTNCTVSGWEDAVAYTPLTHSGDNYIPLFELTKDYAGSTIDVDLFDFGDVTGTNTVAVIDPTKSGCTPSPCDAPGFGGVANAAPACPTCQALQITNNGAFRDGVTPPKGHWSGTHSQAPSGTVPTGSPDDVPHSIPNNGTVAYASWCVAGCPGKPYNGTWIRVSIPIPGNYNPGANDFWYVRYTLSGTAGDTFSFAVSARGGPVHLLKS
jgi:Flp pilus assembly protein TadG